jgi:hypothetical protein
MKTIDLSDLKAGDKAWSVQDGYVKVVHCHDNCTYPIEIKDKKGNYLTYTLNGLSKINNLYPTLFHSEQEFREYWGMESNQLTKREQFAMVAMQGLLANQYSRSTSCEFKVETAIEHADALITKLNETK